MAPQFDLVTEVLRLLNGLTAFAVIQNIAGSYLVLENRFELQYLKDNPGSFRTGVNLFNAGYVVTLILGSFYLHSIMERHADPVLLMNLFKASIVIAFSLCSGRVMRAFVDEHGCGSS